MQKQKDKETKKQRNKETKEQIVFRCLSFSVFRFKRNENGFTLIEMLVVMSIIILISSVSLYSFRSGKSESRLIGATQKLSLDIRRVQNLAASSAVFNNQIPAGYGIYAPAVNATSYILFADLNNSKTYDSGENYESINLEFPLRISGITSSPAGATFPLNIVFTAPEPKVTINNNLIYDSITAVIKFGADGAEKNIYINNFGYINLQ